jgi:hypothetical protein
MSVVGLTVDFPNANDYVSATIRIGLVNTHISADKSEWKTLNPITNEYEKVSSIAFSNGTTIEFLDDGIVEKKIKDGIVHTMMK